MAREKLEEPPISLNVKRSRYTLAVYWPLCKREISQESVCLFILLRWLRPRRNKETIRVKTKETRENNDDEEILYRQTTTRKNEEIDATCVWFSLQEHSRFRIKTSNVRIVIRQLLFSRTCSAFESDNFISPFIRHSQFSLRSDLSSRRHYLWDCSEELRRTPTARKINSARWSRGCVLKFRRKRKLTDVRGKTYRKERKEDERN